MPNYNYEEEARLKRLIKTIKASDIDSIRKNEILDYVTKIKAGRANNDFFDIDTLEAVVLNLLDGKRTKENVSLYDLINTVNFMLPLGEESEDFEKVKNMLASGNLFVDKSLIFLFNDKISYSQFMNIIRKLGILEDKNKFKVLVDYATEVRALCINEDIFKGEILSFAKGLPYELDSLEDYKNNRLLEAKKRSGIYPIGEETLAEISEKYYQIVNLAKTFDDLRTKVNNYTDEINSATRSGLTRLTSETSAMIKKLQADIDEAKNERFLELDEYLLNIKQNMKASSDEAISQVLKDTAEKLNRFKARAEEISTLANGELIRINKATDDFLQTLENNPEVKALVNSPLLEESVRNALASMGNVKMTTPEVVQKTTVVESGIVKMPEIIIPEFNVDYRILPAFDEKIPFDLRLRKIMDRMDERKRRGEIFHSSIPQIIKAIIEGDWPYLYGPSGGGKSFIVGQAASLIGIDLVKNGQITDKTSVMAYNDPHGRFRVTQTFKAVLNGKLLLLDEFDCDNTDTQIVLNEIYSELISTIDDPENQSYITFAEDMTVPVNPNFRMIAVGNTNGLGGNKEYSSRKKMDESVLERTTPIYIDYDSRVEKELLGNNIAWFNIFETFRAACKVYASQSTHRKDEKTTPVEGMVTTRDAAFIAKYIRHNSKTVDELLEEKFIQIKDPTYLSSIANYFTDKYNLPSSFAEPNTDGKALSRVDEKTIAKKLVAKCRTNK